MWRRLFVCTGIGAALVVALPARTLGSGGQAAGAASQAPAPSTFVNLNTVSKDYQVGRGDLLDIQVVGRTEFNQRLRISNSGDISLPMVGLIRVAGLNTFQIEDLIGARLREAGLMQQPEVLVLIREYQAKPVYVSGAVVNPGEFVMSQELTVADAILLAGGLQFNAAAEGFVHRRIAGDRVSEPPAADGSGREAVSVGFEIIKVDLRPLKEGRFFEAALPLRTGDAVVVPHERVNPFFVVGDVIDPRNYFYPDGQSLTASQAISWAKGPTPTAKMSDGMLVRYDERGRRLELKVDYAAILKGTQDDFAIQRNDIIFIPGSRVKTLAHGMLLLTDSMAMSAAFRIGRTYQLPDGPERLPRDPR